MAEDMMSKDSKARAGIAENPEQRGMMLSRNLADNSKKTENTDWRREKAREKTIRRALDYFDGKMPKMFKGRSWALDHIRRAKVPMYEAKRLVSVLHKKGVIAGVSDDGEPDYSDVQELRVRISRSIGIIDAPHTSLLGKMERMIARDEMDRPMFNRMAALVVRMPQALPVELRRLEAAFQRGVAGSGPTYRKPLTCVVGAKDSAALQTALHRPTSSGIAVAPEAAAVGPLGLPQPIPEPTAALDSTLSVGEAA
jgi:hypothetical protein